MPDKIKMNLAKMPQFPRFLSNSRIVRLRSPLPKIIGIIGVLVAGKSDVEILG